MTDGTELAAEAPKRFRSPPYPAIGLAKAIERAKQLHKGALHHAVGVPVLAEAWNYTTKSSGLWATAAALIQFGLLTDEGSGPKRKFQLTEAAIRVVRDSDPTSAKRQEAIRRAALLPMIHRELWDLYGPCDGVSDTVVRSYLTLDRRDEGKAEYSDASADEVIRSFKETISFSGLTQSDAVSAPSEDIAEQSMGNPAVHNSPSLVPPKVKVGDHVQWTSNGVDQFDPPRRVDQILEGGTHLRVFGSLTGIPMSEVIVVDGPPSPGAQKDNSPSPNKSSTENTTNNELNVLLKGDRLQITADLDAAGISKLKEVLVKYEEILMLLG